MPFNKTSRDAHAVARQVMSNILEVGEAVEAASSQMTMDRFDMVVSLPAVLGNFESVIQQALTTFPASVLAPIIADIFKQDVSALVADVQSLRTAAGSLRNLIVQNADQIRHSIDASGGRIYDQPITTAQKTALQNSIDSVLSLYI